MGSVQSEIGQTAPAKKAIRITPHATNTFAVCDALWINDEGVVTVAVVSEEGNNGLPVTWTINGPGLLPVRAQAVRVAGTTAINILALY